MIQDGKLVLVFSEAIQPKTYYLCYGHRFFYTQRHTHTYAHTHRHVEEVWKHSWMHLGERPLCQNLHPGF